MNIWRVRISYDDTFDYIIRDYLVQYDETYTAAEVEDEERISLFIECGSVAHVVCFDVSKV